MSTFSSLLSTLLAACTATVVAQSQGNVSFSLEYVPGFFQQGEPSLPLPSPYPPHMGLIDGKTWAQVDEYMKQQADIGVMMKLIIFLRHGEGTHNVATVKYGQELWDSQYRHLPEYLDTPLTDLGIAQAKNASLMLTEERHHNGLKISQVIVSPLRRTLQTYTFAYERNADIPNVATELSREILGVATCDKRGPIHEKVVQFPHVNFEEIEDDEDPWWLPDHRETDFEIENRCRVFMNNLFYDRESTHIGVVSHSLFGAACLRVLHHRKYQMATAEFVPLLIREMNQKHPQGSPTHVRQGQGGQHQSEQVAHKHDTPISNSKSSTSGQDMLTHQHHQDDQKKHSPIKQNYKSKSAPSIPKQLGEMQEQILVQGQPVELKHQLC